MTDDEEFNRKTNSFIEGSKAFVNAGNVRTSNQFNEKLNQYREENTLLRKENERLMKVATELINLIDTMHKPEYATFFVGEPATAEENQLNGYELADKYREILSIPQPKE